MVKIEQDITQLVELIELLNQEIIQQEPIIQAIEQKNMETADNLGGANVHLQEGVARARRARKLKWWCFGIVVLICIAIALGVGRGISLTRGGGGGGGDN